MFKDCFVLKGLAVATELPVDL